MTQTFVGLHIPKCAGTSFLEACLGTLPKHEIYQNTIIIRNLAEKQPEFLEIRNHSLLRLVWGHGVHEQMLHYFKAPVIFTGLREPRDRLISEARYQADLRERQKREPLDIESWIKTKRNPMCGFIVNRFPTLARRQERKLTPFEKARSALECFNHVYFTETFAESASVLFSILGVQGEVERANVGARPDLSVDISESAINYDLQLYEWASETFGGRSFDPGAPVHPRLAKFLKEPPDNEALSDFLFRSQAGAYYGWGKLDEVIDSKISQAILLMKEISVYRSKKVDM